MEWYVFLLLLAGAACHAAWNAMIKLRLEPLDATILISLGTGVIALPFVPFLGMPDPSSWIFMLGSLAIHFLYYIALAEAYRTGDLGQVYPIARGSAPLLTALTSTVVLDEPLGVLGWAGMLTLTSGIILLSFKGRSGVAHLGHRTVVFSLMTATAIAAYSIVDGLGARTSGNALAYAAILFVTDGLMMLVFGFWRRGCTLFHNVEKLWRTLLLGGAFSSVSYAIAIWAMTKAPLALVSAVRETSVLFAAALSVALLKERVLPARVIAACLVVAGLVIIRLR